jgi:hypothetical protein
MIENSRFHITSTLGGPMLSQDLCASEVAEVGLFSRSMRRGVNDGLSRGFEAAQSIDTALKQLGGADMNGEDVMANYLAEPKMARKEQIVRVLGPSFDHTPDMDGPSLGSRLGM